MAESVARAGRAGAGREVKFVIQGRLPGLNEIVNANRGNRYAGAGQKKKETRRCALEIIRQTTGRIAGPFAIRVTWIERDLRRDPDNVCAGIKFIADALVEVGRIPNDTREFVREIRHVFELPDKKNPRIEVEITDLNKN
jgi:Holliday junction resolvase RusA-like endonuclease